MTSQSELLAKLAKPAQRSLSRAGISSLEQLTEWKEIKELHGMGPKAMEQLREALDEKGFTLKNT